MTYSEMKDSGIFWIGDIPSHWDVSKAKYHVVITNGSDPETQGNIPVYGSGAGSFKTCGEYKEGPAVLIGRKGATLHIPHFIEGRYWNADTAFDVKARKGYSLRYFYYSACCFDYKYYISQTTLPSMTQSNYANMKIPVPSIQEQNNIAAFLDEKCGGIDAIIEEAKTSIEEYKRWKTSVIYQAVTKGLDPDTPLKDSGVPCIGKIPLTAKISRANFHYDIILGKMLSPVPLDDSYTLEPYYCAANVHFEGIASDELKEMWFNEAEKERYLVRRGDLLVVEGGAGAGGCAIAGETIRNAYIQNSIMIVRPKGKQDIRFLRYLIEMLVNRGYMEYVCNKATIPHFTKEKLAAVPYPLFDENDVVKISDYLDRKCAEIDAIISEKQSLIAELEGYKKSLIYEAVTGKRKVG